MSDMTNHELRLLPFQSDEYIWLQPYCACGWIGDTQNVTVPELATHQYRDHIAIYDRIQAIGPTTVARPLSGCTHDRP